MIGVIIIIRLRKNPKIFIGGLDMKNMFEAFTEGVTGTSIGDRNFKANLSVYASKVSNDFVKHGTDMSTSIAKIASRDNLNPDQIKLVVTESNNSVYLAEYNKKKNSNNRDVEFPVASAEKIAAIMSSDSLDMSKFASAKDEPRTSYNSTRNITGAITPAAPMDICGKIAEKLASNISVASRELAEAHVQFDAQIYKVAEMLYQFDRAGIDTDMAYDEICRKNNLRAAAQNIIQEAADDVVGLEKSAGKLSHEYVLKLPFVDVISERPDYSLGAFSKIASMNLADKSMKAFPAIVSNGVLIRSLPDMIKVASKINTLFENVVKKDELFKLAEEKATFEKVGETNAK